MSARGASGRLLASGIVTRLLRVARGLVLARLLLPDVYGEYALIGALVGPLASLTNFGLTPLVARDQGRDERLVATAAWVARATCWAALAALCLGVVVWALVTERLALLGPGLVVAGATALYLAPQVDLGILQQQRRFSHLARIDLAFDVVWTLVALLLAFWLRNVWAFALGEVAAQLARTFAARRAVSPRVEARRHRDVLRKILRFSSGSLAGTFTWAAVLAAPAWLLQRHVGDAAIGQFSLAYTYSQFFAILLGGVANRVSLPAVAGAAEGDRIEEAWRYGQGVSLVLAPLTALLAMVGPWAFVTLVGPRWVDAGALLPILAWGMAVRVIFPFTMLTQVAGRPGIDAAFAALTLAAYAAVEATSGWTTPARAALVVVVADVGFAASRVLVASRLWGAARGAWRLAALAWAGAALSAAAALLVPDGSSTAALGRFALVTVSYATWSFAVPSLRRRYLVELRAWVTGPGAVWR